MLDFDIPVLKELEIDGTSTLKKEQITAPWAVCCNRWTQVLEGLQNENQKLQLDTIELSKFISQSVVQNIQQIRKKQ